MRKHADPFWVFQSKVSRKDGLVFHICPVCGDEVHDRLYPPPPCSGFYDHLSMHKVWMRILN